ncbi:MAG: cyclopropane fatty-acyl-phospholipid synthase-like methyltransferase [Rhodothermales bacterium]|jgi:cyclopropane fatty-acyl-phospholipid synthase-like methyltransferase
MSQVHDAEAISEFFDGWDLYLRVIEHDYMFHRDIHDALRLAAAPFGRVLDIGCGDASTIAHTLTGLPAIVYTGVDLSPVALEAAAKNLGAAGVAARLEEADYMSFLERADSGSFDTLVAGFTVHHLIGDDIARFFRLARNVLCPGGRLLLYDVFREEHEERMAHLARSHAWRVQAWKEMSSDDLAALWRHVSTADYPKSESELLAHAEQAGFPPPSGPLFTAPTGIHRLYAFS